jgi:hypothetical protein
MAEATLELRTILDSAERAAAAQDFASAARFLRQAATLQEVQLGANHPDLANTYNNLGIVYEGLGQTVDAEASYRKSYAIAMATLPVDDPLVVTSRQNLQEFCEACGLPFELEHPSASTPEEPAPPALTDSFAPEPTTPARAVELPRPAPPPKPAASQPDTSAPPVIPRTPPPKSVPVVVPVQPAARARSMTWPVVALGLVVVFVVAFAGPWSGSDDSATPAEPAAAASSSPNVAPVAAAPAEAPAPTEAPASAAPPALREKPAPPVPTSTPTPPPVAETRAPREAPPGSVSLTDARVCRALSTSNWRCTQATNPAQPGVFFFYTRVKSGRPTTVQHRWYLDGNLRRSVNLRIAANPTEGYRTYSRNTVTADRRGEWTIEVRDARGALLHEERLVVR